MKTTREQIFGLLISYEEKINALQSLHDSFADYEYDNAQQVFEEIQVYKRVQNDLLYNMLNEDTIQRDELIARRIVENQERLEREKLKVK